MLDPFDILQMGRTQNAESADSQAQSTTERLAADVRRLEQRCDRFALVCQALWELLREKSGLTDQELLKRIRTIDLRDGSADGRMTPVPVECPSCHRQTNSRRDECLYCGTPLPSRNLFERL